MEFGKSYWKSYERGIEREWLLTNGIGGFASSTIIDSNTRRYHGLLIASLKPPASRYLVLSKIDERVTIDGEIHKISSFRTPDFTSEGFKYLDRFLQNPLPTFVYSVKDIFIEKKISMVYGENTVAIVYKVSNGSSKAVLSLTPLVNFRDYHSNADKQYMNFVQKPEEREVSIVPYNMDMDIKICCSEGKYLPRENDYFCNMDYAIERERGLHATEDHYVPGTFEVEFEPWQEMNISIIATIEKEIRNKDGMDILKKEEKRLNDLAQLSGFEDELAKSLAVAADNFIVHRNLTNSKTIIAGYPWFSDWGRDTLIALPGLTLATKRFEAAKDILLSFSRYVKCGLVPNLLPEDGEEPAYNSVDASLWYFEAVKKYIDYTGDYNFIHENIYDALNEIIEAYKNGTLYRIGMEDDGLITAGNERTQITWMDAKVGDWVVTPRHGKAVEINALWYNALKIFAMLTENRGGDGSSYEQLASKVKESFEEKFWNKEENCLFDVLTNTYNDGSVRPNQIIAVSLSNPVMVGEMAKSVVDKVWKELYTAYGLRSLSPNSKQYVGSYIGDMYRRDGAYHQGTAWAWLIGQFVTAFVRVNGGTKEAKEKAKRFIEPFRDHLRDACIGSISEIFDGNQPLLPRGCFAQAWSVGEILRAYTEDIL